MGEKMLDKIEQYMLDNHMPVKNGHVIVGVSGGADSMCLLFVMLSLQSRLNMTVTAVHIHHGLRGAEADADEAFTKAFCQAQGIECVTFRTDIRAMAYREKLTEEEAGRKYRYMCFEQVRAQKHASCIAVAHHQDDQAETVLFNLARGSGLAGLAGIAPVRDKIIRPLLCLNRREIEALLKKNHIDFCTDRTNFDTNYTRNKLRHQVLPYLTEEINSETVAHISKAAANVRAALEYIRQQADEALSCVSMQNQPQTLQCRLFLQYPEIIQKEMLRSWLDRHTGSLKDITETHIEALIDLAKNQSGRRIHLPYGWIAVRSGEGMTLKYVNENTTQKTSPEIEISHMPCVIEIEPGMTVTFDFLSLNEEENEEKNEENLSAEKFLNKEKLNPENFSKENLIIPENACTKWMDYDKIKGSLKIRHRQSSDVISIRGGRHKKLRRVMIDDKIPEDIRNKLWLLADGNDILCILGGRMGEDYKVTKDTRTILIVGIKEKS